MADKSQPADTVVMFVDMLGFGSLLRQHPDVNAQDFELAAEFSATLGSHSLENRLASTFALFHRVLDKEIRFMTRSLYIDRHFHAITFSDSAFLMMPDVEVALAQSANMMQKFIAAEVPVRIGIGCGTFRILNFKSESRRDVIIHTSQFLGTAILNSYQAERAPQKGLRVFLHSSAVAAAKHCLWEDMIMPLADAASDTDVPAEANYLERKRNADTKLFAALRKMETQWPPARLHYQATYEAFNRMRTRYGREPLT